MLCCAQARCTTCTRSLSSTSGPSVRTHPCLPLRCNVAESLVGWCSAPTLVVRVEGSVDKARRLADVRSLSRTCLPYSWWLILAAVVCCRVQSTEVEDVIESSTVALMDLESDEKKVRCLLRLSSTDSLVISRLRSRRRLPASPSLRAQRGLPALRLLLARQAPAPVLLPWTRAAAMLPLLRPPPLALALPVRLLVREPLLWRHLPLLQAVLPLALPPLPPLPRPQPLLPGPLLRFRPPRPLRPCPRRRPRRACIRRCSSRTRSRSPSRTPSASTATTDVRSSPYRSPPADSFRLLYLQSCMWCSGTSRAWALSPW